MRVPFIFCEEYKMSSVTIGSLVMSRQAAIALVAGMVVSTSMIIKGRYAEGVAMSILIAVHSYGINCMSVGHCDTYAWFIAILLLIVNVGTLFINKKMVR
jgi:hypothetical protein